MAAIAGGTFLVTGGASLVGSHIADVLLAQGAAEVRLFDNLSLGTAETIRHLENDARVKFIKGDVRDPRQVQEATHGASGVFALAALLTLSMATHPALGIEVNYLGFLNTIEACRIAKVSRILFASSVGVYGNTDAAEITEETPFTRTGTGAPYQLYAASKLMGEALCAQYSKLHSLEFNAVRIASVYGERQHDRAVNANFIAALYDQVKRGEPPVIVGDGSEVHDYIYVTDVAEACVAAMASASHGHAMNVATGIDTTHTRVAELVVAACGAKNLAPAYRPDNRPVKSSASAHLNFSRAKAQREIGWAPKVSVEDGIRRYVAWRRSNTG